MKYQQLSFARFQKDLAFSLENFCRELFKVESGIQVRKEVIAVKNLRKIVTAALKLCNSKGFSAMSMRDLSRESGLSMGALYLYFQSKEDLLRMIQDNGVTYISSILEQEIDSQMDPLLRLEKAIYVHVFLSEIMRDWFYFLYIETRHFPEKEYRKALDAELATEKLFLDILISGNSDKAFTCEEPQILSGLIKAMLQDWYIKKWKHSRRKITPEKYAEYVFRLVCSFILSDSEHGYKLIS